jgi:hypothetical protein
MKARLELVAVLTAAIVSACGSPRMFDTSDGGSSLDTGGDMSNVNGPRPPRLVAPLSTATATSRRPTLRWILAANTDGAHVQICRDRACVSEVTTFDAGGSSGRPASDLPIGTVFWRAYGQQGTVTCLAVFGPVET